MTKPNNLKVGDKFRVIEADNGFKLGEIISLERDDGTDRPFFWKEDKSGYRSMFWSELEPYTKTIRDAQVGDVVVRDCGADERMVLERGQSTVILSFAGDFKIAGHIFTFDELEEYYTLKNAPEGEAILSMAQIAEKFGINISNLKITKD